MNRLSISDARRNFSDTVNRVSYGGERIVLDRNGKEVAALISLEDLELLEALEDRMDAEEARRVLSEEEFIDWDALTKGTEP